MKIVESTIEGVLILQNSRFEDERGSFSRIFCNSELEVILGDRQIKQINHSYTRLKGTVRGMHFQYPPAAEMKIIFCIKGGVFDVAVDLRRESPTQYKWHAETLAEADNKAIVIPEGCAHGFQTLQADTELLYLHTNYYIKESESGVKFDDPELAIEWPEKITCVSEKDASHKKIDSNFQGIEI